MFNTSSLLAGGLIAAIVAGWNQLKSFLIQISGFLIVRVEFDDTAYATVYSYLRRNWRLLPTGQHLVFTQWLTLKRGDRVGAPFRRNGTSSPSIFVRNREVVIFRGAVMTTFRGVTDYREVITAAFKEKERLNDVGPTTKYRGRGFFVAQIFGPVSLSKRFGTKGSVEKRSQSDSDEPASISGSSGGCDPLLEDSLLYERSSFASSIGEDARAGRVFAPSVESLFRDADIWASQEKWYSERRLPWRRGWLLFGPPGTGKSTVAEQAAKQLNVPLYVFHLRSFDDESFHDRWVGLPRPCVVLFDDFDSVFNIRTPCHEAMELTFDCLLNTLSGPGDLSHGILTVFTTNRPETFDPALASPAFGRPELESVSRPGRVDRVLELGYIPIESALEIVKIVTRDDVSATEEAMERIRSSDISKITPISALDAARSVVQSKLTFVSTLESP